MLLLGVLVEDVLLEEVLVEDVLAEDVLIDDVLLDEVLAEKLHWWHLAIDWWHLASGLLRYHLQRPTGALEEHASQTVLRST